MRDLMLTDTPVQGYDATRRALHFEQWRRKQATAELHEYIDHLPHYSADGYKDDPHRDQSLHQYGANRARETGDGEALAEKKESLKDRWSLPSYAEIRV